MSDWPQIKIEKVADTTDLVEITISYPDFMVELLNYGAGVSGIWAPDRQGKLANIVLHFPDKKRYLAERSFLGSSVGRCAGRIEKGEFSLNNQLINLELNEGDNHLHGGSQGFDNVYWDYQVIEKTAATTVMFTKNFSAGEAGYPGNLAMTISYTISPDQTVEIEYSGLADEDTLLNPTNHTYFNLAGNHETLADHFLQINSQKVAYLQRNQLPAFPLQSVAETAFDFQQPVTLTEVFSAENNQIVQEKGLNHPFLLLENSQPQVTLFHSLSGRRLQLTTSAASVVCYTGNHFKLAKEVAFHGGVALETQELYLTKNGENNPKIIVKKGQKFSSWTQWRFGVKNDSV